MSESGELMQKSEEFELDRRLSELVGKMVDRTAAPGDYEEYERLSKRRVELMLPKVPARVERLRRFA